MEAISRSLAEIGITPRILRDGPADLLSMRSRIERRLRMRRNLVLMLRVVGIRAPTTVERCLEA
jgi:hypothetical protein